MTAGTDVADSFPMKEALLAGTFGGFMMLVLSHHSPLLSWMFSGGGHRPAQEALMQVVSGVLGPGTISHIVAAQTVAGVWLMLNGAVLGGGYVAIEQRIRLPPMLKGGLYGTMLYLLLLLVSGLQLPPGPLFRIEMGMTMIALSLASHIVYGVSLAAFHSYRLQAQYRLKHSGIAIMTFAAALLSVLLMVVTVHTAVDTFGLVQPAGIIHIPHVFGSGTVAHIGLLAAVSVTYLVVLAATLLIPQRSEELSRLIDRLGS